MVLVFLLVDKHTKMSEADSLSAEDLRNKLYHSLREKGLVDSLKVNILSYNSYGFMMPYFGFLILQALRMALFRGFFLLRCIILAPAETFWINDFLVYQNLK